MSLEFICSSMQELILSISKRGEVSYSTSRNVEVLYNPSKIQHRRISNQTISEDLEADDLHAGSFRLAHGVLVVYNLPSQPETQLILLGKRLKGSPTACCVKGNAKLALALTFPRPQFILLRTIFYSAFPLK